MITVDNLTDLEVVKQCNLLFMKDKSSGLEIDMSYDGVEHVRTSYLIHLYNKGNKLVI